MNNIQATGGVFTEELRKIVYIYIIRIFDKIKNTNLYSMKAPNAIILAAGKSTRSAPFTYERPKGIFSVSNGVFLSIWDTIK